MNKVLVLSNGKKIPALAYGTWLIPNDIAAECVKNAIEAGYRHIDTAQAYGNEVGVGEGIRLSGIKREDIYVTTKVMAEFKTYDEARISMEDSLKRLGLDYVDLILIHCPQPWREFRGVKRYFEENIQVWKALEEFYLAGKAKAIGISNFLVDDIENITNNCSIKPMVNQILCHIGSTPVDVIKYCQENGIVVEAYSPMGHGRILDNEPILKMAEKYGVSVAQLCIKYTLQIGTVSIPKAKSKQHIIEDTKLDFEISQEDMVELMKLNDVDYGEDAFWPVFRQK